MQRSAYSTRMLPAIALLMMIPSPALAQRAPQVSAVITPVGVEEVIFEPRRDACDGHDVPDLPLRAWRDDTGAIHAFALHYENRRLFGPTLASMKPDCKVVFRGTTNGDPRRYDDASWIAATWTSDGKRIHGLVHHEFHANQHKGRCSKSDHFSCWWNSVLAIRSEDGGKSFSKLPEPVIAASPERSEVDQGRHRGFFNPSNIIERDGAHYVLIGTTGWQNQRGGVCLFRSTNLAAGDWRAFDGRDFNSRFPDPYTKPQRKLPTCQTMAPFPAPVGSISRHRGTGLYIGVYMAQKGMSDGRGGTYAQSGFYAATSRDLINWSAPNLIMKTYSLYDEPCGTGVMRSYPALIDTGATTRNFEDVGDNALLSFTRMRVDGCNHTGDRQLITRRVRISFAKRQ